MTKALTNQPSFVTIAQDGFKDTATANGKNITAQQRLAAAFMMFHADAIANSTADWPSMDNVRNSAKAQTSMMHLLMVATHLTPRPKHEKGTFTDKIARDLAAWVAEERAVARAIKLAVELDSYAVVASDFDIKRGMFAVPTDALVPHKHTATGSLGSKAKTNDTVLLDGSRYSIETPSGSIKAINASVAQVAAAAASRTAKPATATDATPAPVSAGANATGVASATAAPKAETLGLNALLIEAARILKTGNGDSRQWSTLPAEVQNAMVDIVQWFDECKGEGDVGAATVAGAGSTGKKAA